MIKDTAATIPPSSDDAKASKPSKPVLTGKQLVRQEKRQKTKSQILALKTEIKSNPNSVKESKILESLLIKKQKVKTMKKSYRVRRAIRNACVEKLDVLSIEPKNVKNEKMDFDKKKFVEVHEVKEVVPVLKTSHVKPEKKSRVVESVVVEPVADVPVAKKLAFSYASIVKKSIN